MLVHVSVSTSVLSAQASVPSARVSVLSAQLLELSAQRLPCTLGEAQADRFKGPKKLCTESTRVKKEDSRDAPKPF